MIETVRWQRRDGRIVCAPDAESCAMPGVLRLMDQTRLPEEEIYGTVSRTDTLIDAIRRLVVRGAPAIGCAAALGLAAAAEHYPDCLPEFAERLRKEAAELAVARPTAVNLRWAVNRVLNAFFSASPASVPEARRILRQEGLSILAEDIQLCRAIGRNGLPLLPSGTGVLTHCNAGALAAGDAGTALAPVYAAHGEGRNIRVYSDETRPLLQGSRLTAWELHRAGVEVWTICDNMAAQVMREGRIQLVIVGADRIAANGDTANKIGTYGVALLAQAHKIPFYVAAPYSTFDLSIADGSQIPIEERNPEEIRHGFGHATAPEGIHFYNPAFDVTPAELIAGFITEKGILHPPFGKNLTGEELR